MGGHWLFLIWVKIKMQNTTSVFSEYTNNRDLDLSKVLDGDDGEVCTNASTIPSNNTIDILDGSVDFVDGPFARMSRSPCHLGSCLPTICPWPSPIFAGSSSPVVLALPPPLSRARSSLCFCMRVFTTHTHTHIHEHVYYTENRL